MLILLIYHCIIIILTLSLNPIKMELGSMAQLFAHQNIHLQTSQDNMLVIISFLFSWLALLKNKTRK